VWACAILPEHIHLVVGRFRLPIEQVVIQLKGEATQRLLEEGIHPFGHLRESNGRPPKCFARGEWSVFLETPEDIERAIAYVANNAGKEGLKPQTWPFVVPFDPSV
jgi:REP element-mobilizing transposase RayT